MHPLKKLLGQTAVYGLSSIVGRLLNYLLVPLYTRLFLPAEYGVVAEFYTYIGFLLVMLTYGMETGFFRFAGESTNKNDVYSTTIIPLFITSLLFIVLCTVFSNQIAELLNYTDHTEYIVWIAVIAGADAFMTV